MFFVELSGTPIGCLFVIGISVVLYSIGASGVTFLFGTEDSATQFIAGLITLIVGWIALFVLGGSLGDNSTTYDDDGYPTK